jgi:hypothetical protein
VLKTVLLQEARFFVFFGDNGGCWAEGVAFGDNGGCKVEGVVFGDDEWL